MRGSTTPQCPKGSRIGREECGTQTAGERPQKVKCIRTELFRKDYMDWQFYRLRNAEITPPAARVARAASCHELERRAGRSGIEGVTAQRALNALSSGLNFYLARDFTAAANSTTGWWSSRAWTAGPGRLSVGCRTLPVPAPWWSCKDAAVAALERALELGFDRDQLLATDPDLTRSAAGMVSSVAGCPSVSQLKVQRSRGAKPARLPDSTEKRDGTTRVRGAERTSPPPSSAGRVGWASAHLQDRCGFIEFVACVNIPDGRLKPTLQIRSASWSLQTTSIRPARTPLLLCSFASLRFTQVSRAGSPARGRGL